MKMPDGETFSLHELIGLLIFVKAILTKIAFNCTSLENTFCSKDCKKTKYVLTLSWL